MGTEPPLAPTAAGAGEQLQPTNLFAHERGPREGAVLTLAEHVPGDHDEPPPQVDSRENTTDLRAAFRSPANLWRPREHVPTCMSPFGSSATRTLAPVLPAGATEWVFATSANVGWGT